MATYVYDKDGKIIAGLNSNSSNFDKYKAEYESQGYKVDTPTPKPSKPIKNQSLNVSSYGNSLALDGKGWYVTAEGKHLNPKFYDEYGNKITAGGSSAGGSSGGGSFAGNNDMLDEINRLRKQRVSSRKAALGGLYNKTLTGLATEKTNVKGQYYDAKNQESSSAQIRAKKLEELMAAKGYGAGTQAQNELMGNVSLQNTLGGLKRQEQSAYDDIAKRGTDAETEYQTGLVQADADAETTASQARLAELGQQRDYSRQDEQTDYERSRQDLLDTRYDQENEKSDFIKNTTMYSYPDIQAEINTIMNDNDTANDWKIPILKDIRGQKIEKQLNEEIKTAGQYSGNFQSEIARREKTSEPLDNALIPYLKAMMAEQQATPSERYKQLWDMFMKTGVITTDEMASVLGQPIGTTTTDYLQTKYNIGKPYSGGGSSSGSSSGAGGEVPWYLQ
jgi:hypothetical protein